MVLQTALSVPFLDLSPLSVHRAANQIMSTQQRLRVSEGSYFETSVFPRDFSLIESDSASIEGPCIVSDEDDAGSKHASEFSIPTDDSALSQSEREQLSRSCHAAISQLESARQSRTYQRWARNPFNRDSIVRLVAGCIPILKDGRVLLISSQKPAASLSLPKGGWEMDESLEQGALRETFEEAGVLGVLGPPMPSFLLESKKKRSEPKKSGSMDDSSSSASSLSVGTCSPLPPQVSFWDVNTLKPFATPSNDSFPSTPVHSHTCLTFFPLYVTEVKNEWPEHTRQRRAFPIEVAIQLVRPEFRWMLEQIQRERLLR